MRIDGENSEIMPATDLNELYSAEIPGKRSISITETKLGRDRVDDVDPKET
jgi:hypothetical protein